MTAINDTGQHDAQKANDAVECFVRYLRSTVDVRQNDKLILFEQELAHLHDDVALFCRWCRKCAFPNRAYDRWNNDNRESSGSGYKGYDHDAILYDVSGIVTLLS